MVNGAKYGALLPLLNSPKQILIALNLALLLNSVAYAQIKIGDIEVSSMQQIFNADNDDLWGKKKMGGTYKFKELKF